MQSEQPIIRIVKKKKGGAAAHGGAWKVAYADFVTAMMAFFLVMWIIGLSATVRKAVAAYFKDPEGVIKNSAGGTKPLSHGDEMASTNGKPSIFLPTGMDGLRYGQVESAFKHIEQQILQKMQDSKDFSKLKDSIHVTLTNQGLRIDLMEKTHALFFSTGSAALQPRTINLLHMIASEVGKLKYPVVVEGDTDARPFHGPDGETNWELSVNRANAARRAMEGHGLRKGQVLEVRGYGDKKLLDPEHPYSYVNRRVSILVAYTGKGT